MTEENNDYSYLLDILKLAEAGEEKEGQEKLNLTFSGELLTGSEASKVNQSLLSVILKDSEYNASVFTRNKIQEVPGSKLITENLNRKIDNPDFLISHYCSPVLMLPEKGQWIVFQNWDYGSLPASWLEAFNDYVDQIWVSSHHNSESYLKSNIGPERIRVINSGVDSLTFNPHVTPLDLKTNKKYKFLYKGDLSWETGFDLLLKAFSDEFYADNDVCLVIATETDKISQQNRELIENLKKDFLSPEIILYNITPENENLLPQLYKSCNYYAAPYRTESYCLDIIEAMACGVPCLVTDYGASKDYCSENDSILVPAELIYQQEKNINNLATASFPSWAGIELINLRVKLREAVELDENRYRELSKNASKKIFDNFTWVKINEKLKTYLKELKTKPVKRETQQQLNLQLLDGLKLINQGRFSDAAELFKAIHVHNPGHPNLNFYLASLYLGTGKYNEALEHISVSLEKQPDNEDFLNLAGVILFKLNHFPLASSLFQKVLEINPSHNGAVESLKATAEQSEKNESVEEPSVSKIRKLFYNSGRIPTLSICIIARNEQHVIKKAINSVKDIADEIIILDTGSTDKTRDIVAKLITEAPGKIKLYEATWENSFAKARNEAMKYATKDWILMLDADEIITSESRASIRPTLLKCTPDKVYLPRVINTIDKYSSHEIIEHYVPRLIPNYQGIKFIRDIHEIPVAADNSLLPSENLKGFDIEHSGYKTEIVKAKDKIKRNRELLEKMTQAEPENPINYFYMAENYKEESNYQKVAELSEKALSLSDGENANEYESILKMVKINLIEALMVLQKYDEAEDYAERFKEKLSERPDFWFLYGNTENALGNYDKAIEYQKKALGLRGKDVFPSVDMGTFTWKPLAVIAKIYAERNDHENAIRYYTKAIKEAPQNLHLHYALSKIYAEKGNIEQLERYFYAFSKMVSPSELLSILKHIEAVYLEKGLEDKFYNQLEGVRSSLSKFKSDDKTRALYEELIGLYKKIAEKRDDLLAVKYSIACCYGMIGDNETAENLFQEILNEDELEVDSIHNLATFAFNRGDYAKAEEFYKKALEIDEFHSQTFISLTKLEMSRKNFEKAREYLEELETIDPDNSEISLLEMEMARLSGDKQLAADLYSAMLFNNF